MVEKDLGAEIARAVARKMVVYYRRAGGQSQFSTLLELEPKSDRIQRVLDYAGRNLKGPLSVDELAAALSPRQFSRAFPAETGQSPARAIEHLRVEATRVLIEQGRDTLDRQIADSISAFGFPVPILIDEDNLIIAGHGRYAAAKLLGLKEVPVIGVQGLSEGKRRALAIADNKIAENAGWDREVLAIELPELAEVLVVEGLDISITGFAPVEIDQLTADFEEDSSDPADAIDPEWAKTAPVTKPGDLWELGHHRILCGDARGAEDLALLMEGTQAAMAFLDPPYNVRVRDIVGRGRVKHTEFAMASGELSRVDFVAFLNSVLAPAAAVSRGGAVHFVCMDWRHVGELLEFEPRFVDVAIKRWRAFSRKDAIHAETGLTFDEVVSKRIAATPANLAPTDVR